MEKGDYIKLHFGDKIREAERLEGEHQRRMAYISAIEESTQNFVLPLTREKIKLELREVELGLIVQRNKAKKRQQEYRVQIEAAERRVALLEGKPYVAPPAVDYGYNHEAEQQYVETVARIKEIDDQIATKDVELRKQYNL